MKYIFQIITILISSSILSLNLRAQPQSNGHYLHKLDNPVSADYLKDHLSPTTPRLILTPTIEHNLQEKLRSDTVIQKYYAYLQKEAEIIMKEPLLEHDLEGFRLLAVAREMVRRMSTLGIVYRVEKSKAILERIDQEVIKVCLFEDWNPQHFLDIAEMSFAVAIAIDWVGQALPRETVRKAKLALIDKGIKPSFNEGGTRMYWINGSNNWNAVCHGGMIAASLAVADLDPDLAAKTISRALDKLPNSLKEYAPDGIYPEGPTYWGYGTAYTVIASAVLSSALGSDFGISESPGFLQSADFRLQATAPSGAFFNFADSGDRNDGSGSVLMCWFAAQTGDGLYFDQPFFQSPQHAGRFAGLGLIWLSQFNLRKQSELITNWHGQGTNPVAVFRGKKEDPNRFYLAVKGGKAHLSHGNMDAGTFVFDLYGERWVIDPGNQSYYPLNKIGFNLAGHCQDCPRWTLLTKQNQGHSTITINDALFNVNGYASIVDFQEGTQPEVTIDMTELYDGRIASLRRRFIKETDKSILIEDRFEINDSTKNITWGLMTAAEVEVTKDGAYLIQNDKKLKLSILSPDYLQISIISLNPPPQAIDKRMENLKRIEIRMPAYTVTEKVGIIKVRLSGE